MTLSNLNIVSSLILLVAVCDDLWTRKFHNWLFLLTAVTAILFSFGWGGVENGLSGLRAGGVAFLLMAPLFWFRIVGGGDLKLFVVLGLSSNSEFAFQVFLYSLIWGALLGVLRALIGGEIRQMLSNLKIISMKLFLNRTYEEKIQEKSLMAIPYTVAIALGWFSYLSQGALI